MRLIVIACLGFVAILAVACGGGEKPRLLTSTPSTPSAVPPPTPSPTPDVPRYKVSGVLLSSSNNLLLGGVVTLDPSGLTGTADYIDAYYEITGVPDGEYIVNVTPKCVAHGCYSAPFLFVDGSDVTEFSLAPLPAKLLPGGPPAVRFLSGESGASLQLDQIEFAADNLILIGPSDMQPSESAQIVLAGPQCIRCAPLLAVDAPVEWSVVPPVGVHFEPETGLLTVNSGAPIGSTYTVTADVGEFSITKEISIYSAETNPLVGVWTESGAGNINQLLLTSTGQFAVTANPYEHYQDYWGTYIFNLSTGFIELKVTGANQVAPDAQGTGTFTIDARGRLILEGICLGGWDGSTQSLAMNCGHEFQKQ